MSIEVDTKCQLEKVKGREKCHVHVDHMLRYFATHREIVASDTITVVTCPDRLGIPGISLSPFDEGRETRWQNFPPVLLVWICDSMINLSVPPTSMSVRLMGIS